jgi:hypothetical protein
MPSRTTFIKILNLAETPRRRSEPCGLVDRGRRLLGANSGPGDKVFRPPLTGKASRDSLRKNTCGSNRMIGTALGVEAVPAGLDIEKGVDLILADADPGAKPRPIEIF